jgi:hypothetical protein
VRADQRSIKLNRIISGKRLVTGRFCRKKTQISLDSEVAEIRQVNGYKSRMAQTILKRAIQQN